MKRLGIIGGTALRQLKDFEVAHEGWYDTKFYGLVWLATGRLLGVPTVFIPRHGRHHEWLPSEINFIGNAVAMKLHGVTDVIAVTAMGGLASGYSAGTLAFVDRTGDKTHGRPSTSYGDGIVGHIARPRAVCPQLHGQLVNSANVLGITHQKTADLVVINGPQFSSEPESREYRSAGYHVIGMTSEPEAKLMQEFGLHYAIIGLITDDDNPVESSGHAVNQVTVSQALSGMAEKAENVIRATLQDPLFDMPTTCQCASVMKGAILTDPTGPIQTKGRDRICHIHGLKEIPADWFAGGK
ncbi:MAG: MTAP family purine nucleoside phosphorylase [bacterium]|nr:MTAP family purine nucleoside phosphorylase [bacterium]